MTKTYPSRIDWWLALLFVAMTVVPLAFGIALLPDNLKRGVVLLAVGGFNLAFFLLLVIPTTYTLTETDLEIRSGAMRTRIPLQTISSVEPPVASPRRVRIVHGTESLVLTPREYADLTTELRTAVARVTGKPLV